jgi:predicted ATP-binding protein involved in virulence
MLLYLWIKEYKLIKNIGFNLSSEYILNYVPIDSTEDKIKGELSCCKVVNPKLFNGKIKSIKAIIGENGSGKSTLIKLLCDILLYGNIETDFILVTDKYIFKSFEGEIDHNFKIDGKKLEEKQSLINNDENLKLLKPSVIFYSPYLNLDRIESFDNRIYWPEVNYWEYIDISTESLIYHDTEKNAEIGCDYLITETSLLEHKAQESKRNLEFLASEYFNDLKLFENRIEYVTVQLNGLDKRFWTNIDNLIKDDQQVRGGIQSVFTSFELANQLTYPKGSFESDIYKSILYGALKNEYIRNTNFSNASEQTNAAKETIGLLNKAITDKTSYKDVLEAFLRSSEAFPKKEKYLEDTLTHIGCLVDFMTTLTYSANIEYFELPFPNKDSAENKIKDFIDLYFDNKYPFYNIFSIEYEGLSSGEKTMLSMFSRFKLAIDLIDTENKSSDTITMLLDEPEVTFHPRWQAMFIEKLDCILPKMIKNKNIQIVLTSHSPIIVSDFPKSYILFLEKDRGTGDCVMSHFKEGENTFGANIHSLYANAFFLEKNGGTIGSFAKRNILNVVQELRKKKPKHEDNMKLIIESIGEPLVKNSLLEIFNSKFPNYGKSIEEQIQYHQKEIDKLKNQKQ